LLDLLVLPGQDFGLEFLRRQINQRGMKPLFLVDNFDKLFNVAVSFFKIVVFIQIDFVVFQGSEKDFGNVVESFNG
jgi:hypothetical protein